MRDEKKREDKIKLDFGLGGLFKGIGNLLELVQDMAEKGQTISEEQGKIFEKIKEFKGTGSLKDLSGVYGVTVRFGGLGGEARSPVVEPFGNIKRTPEGPVVEEVREPLVDVFEEEDTIQVIFELPGVSESDVKVEVQGDILNLSAEGKTRKYSKELLLSSPVKAETMTTSFQNGILEIKLEKVKGSKQ